jgi:hypothetical protein
MQLPIIKTYNPTAQKEPFQFYVLNKGKNSGRPSYSPNPNCFVVSCQSSDHLQDCYTICFVLWKGRSFERLLCGSVIEFIRLKEFQSVLKQAFCQLAERRDRLVKVSSLLKTLEESEQRISRQLSLVKQMKVSLVTELFSNG